MKRIENCETNEIIRPVMDGWHSDGGGGHMWQNQEYYVLRHYKDEWSGKGRLYAPYSFVKVRDGAGLDFNLNYGRYVIGRLEPAPTLGELGAMPQEFWVSSNGAYYENGLNRERFMKLVKEAESQGIKVSAPRASRVRSSGTTFSLNMDNINQAASLTRQATTCLSIIIEAGKQDGIGEQELAELLRANGFKLNTKQDPWKIFHFYKKTFIDAGLLVVEEN